MARGFRGLVLETRNIRFAAYDAKALAPAPDIGRVGRAVRAPAGGRVVVPGPASGNIDLEADASAQALALGDACGVRCFCHRRPRMHPACLTSSRGGRNAAVSKDEPRISMAPLPTAWK